MITFKILERLLILYQYLLTIFYENSEETLINLHDAQYIKSLAIRDYTLKRWENIWDIL